MTAGEYRTRTGRVLTDADIEAMAAEAERGYDLPPRSGRPEDPCPQCGEADLEPFGGKHRCPACGYLQPCCQPG